MKHAVKFGLIVIQLVTISIAAKVSMVTSRCLNDANWGTHQTPLIVAVNNTEGPILEFGCGDFSTPLLHALCSPKKRFILSADTDNDWLNLFRDLETSWHQFRYVPVFENCPNQDRVFGGNGFLWDTIGGDSHWGVVFIDHAPAIRRPVDLQRLRGQVDIFVVHDTQVLSAHGYDRIFPTFKYCYTYMRYATQTTLLSDVINVSQLFED